MYIYSTAILFNFNFVCKYVQLEMQCSKICRHGHCEVWQAMSRRKLSAPQGRWNRCGSFDDCQTNARCMGPEKPADAISKVALCMDGRQLRSLCIDIFTCHDETIRAMMKPAMMKQSVPWWNLPWWNNPCHDETCHDETCHDETIRAITVIRLNLNPPFKDPRSSTGLVCVYFTPGSFSHLRAH